MSTSIKWPLSLRFPHQQTCMHFSCLKHVPHVPLISFFFGPRFTLLMSVMEWLRSNSTAFRSQRPQYEYPSRSAIGQMTMDNSVIWFGQYFYAMGTCYGSIKSRMISHTNVTPAEMSSERIAPTHTHNLSVTHTRIHLTALGEHFTIVSLRARWKHDTPWGGGEKQALNNSNDSTRFGQKFGLHEKNIVTTQPAVGVAKITKV